MNQEFNKKKEQVFIGQRVQLIGKHPHAGGVGYIDRLGNTAVGTGFVVSLDDGIECYVFKPEHIKFLGQKRQ